MRKDSRIQPAVRPKIPCPKTKKGTAIFESKIHTVPHSFLPPCRDRAKAAIVPRRVGAPSVNGSLRCIISSGRLFTTMAIACQVLFMALLRWRLTNFREVGDIGDMPSSGKSTLEE